MIPTNPRWKVVLRFVPSGVQALVTDQGDDVLKARLSSYPGHPRALVTLMEGLALWCGTALCVAVCVDDDAQDCFERVFYGNGFLGPESPLVDFEHHHREERPYRLRGVGDFRQLRLPWGPR